MIVHESIEDSKIDGYDIRVRIRVFVNVWAIGRDPDLTGLSHLTSNQRGLLKVTGSN